MDARRRARGVEGEPHQQAELVERVHAVHVVARIRFGISGLLRGGERVLQRLALRHAGEDVVAGAVDDRAQLQHAVGRQVVGERRDQRDASAHRRFVAQLHALDRRQRGELRPVPGEDALVGGDHRLAALQRRADQGAGGFLAAEQFHHQVHVGSANHRCRIGGELLARERPWAREIAHRGPLQDQVRSGGPREHVVPLDQRARHRLAHRAHAEKADPNCLHARESTNFDTVRLTSCGRGSGLPRNGPLMSGELTSLCHKLGIKEGRRVLVLDPPVGFVRKLDPLPPGVGVTTKVVSLADVIVVFSSPRAVLGELFPKAKHALAPRGALWVAWPRKSSGFFTDLDEALVRAVGLAGGLTDNKIIAVDEIWSALRFVEKERDRLPLPRISEISAPDA